MDWVPGHFPTDSHGLPDLTAPPFMSMKTHGEGCTGVGHAGIQYGRNEVRNFLISNALFWFENYHLDGIRDAVASMLYLDYNRESGEWLPNHYGGRENLEAVTFIRQLNRVLFEKFRDSFHCRRIHSLGRVSHPLIPEDWDSTSNGIWVG